MSRKGLGRPKAAWLRERLLSILPALSDIERMVNAPQIAGRVIPGTR